MNIKLDEYEITKAVNIYMLLKGYVYDDITLYGNNSEKRIYTECIGVESISIEEDKLFSIVKSLL